MLKRLFMSNARSLSDAVEIQTKTQKITWLTTEKILFCYNAGVLTTFGYYSYQDAKQELVKDRRYRDVVDSDADLKSIHNGLSRQWPENLMYSIWFPVVVVKNMVSSVILAINPDSR